MPREEVRFAEFALTEIGTQMAISDRLLTVMEDRDPSLRGTTITVIVQSLTKEVDAVSYPQDWWQAFKAQWFPRWLKRRFPPLYFHKMFSRYCPHKAVPEDEPHYDFLKNGGEIEKHRA